MSAKPLTQSLPEPILEEAADWLIKMQAAPLNETEAIAFKQWLAQAPAHQQAWQRAEKLATKLGDLSPTTATAVLDRPENPERRAAVAKLALLIGAVPAGWGAWELVQQHSNRADYMTGVGEQKTLTIADGSQLVLNTDSAIDVVLDNAQRLILLRNGEVHVQTASNPDKRPFLVQTAEGRLRALGTRFTVHQLSGRTHLAVLEGAVEVTPLAGTARVIKAGRQTQFNTHGVDTPTVADELDAAWTAGMLMANAMPLYKLADQLSRYRRGKLRLDPDIRMLAVSGSYPLTDTDKALDMLAGTYPVRVNKALFGYLTTISAQ